MTDILELMRSSLKNIAQNKYRYLLTTILLQLVLGILGRYLLAFWFNFSLNLAGVSNLTKDNFLQVLNQTGPFLALSVYILLVAALIFGEFMCLTYMVISSYRELNFREMLRGIWRNVKWLTGPQILLFLVYLLLMIPLGNLGLSSILLEKFRIPDFIFGEFSKTLMGSLGYYSFLALILYLNLRLIYFLPLAVVNQGTLWDNILQSWRLTKRRKLSWMVAIAGLIMGLTTLVSLLVLILLMIFGLVDSGWNNIVLPSLFYSLVRTLFYLITFLSKLIMVEVLINHLFRLEEATDSLSYLHLSDRPAKPFVYPGWSKTILAIVAVFFVLGNGLQVYLLNLNSKSLMIAHRGDVSAGVENSLEALEAASHKGANLVEMDVLLTSDHQLLVGHDNHLKRLAGLDIKVSETSLADLEGLAIYQGKFKGQLVSFETYYQKAKALNQPLLIELKPHGQEPEHYVDLILKEFRRLGVGNKDKVMSLDLDLMEAIEAKAPELTTGYVIPLQFGPFDNKAVDFYVIEDFSYNELTMLSAVQEKKDLYVWTINDEASLTRYLQSPVNGIITDELDLYKKEKEELASDDSYYARVLRLLSFGS